MPRPPHARRPRLLRSTVTLLTAFTLGVATLTACAPDAGTGADGDDTATVTPTAAADPGSGPGTDPAPATPSPTRDPQAIRAADLGSLAYRVGADERRVRLKGGKARDNLARTYQLGKKIAYADADADGFEDAAVEIRILDGNGYEALWYVLLWDPDEQAPRQLVDPLARTARCGDAVDAVKAAPKGFAITEHRRSGFESTCADVPDHKVSRQVSVTDGWLTETSPHQGYGGICPGWIATEAFDLDPGVTLRVGWTDKAPAVGDTAVRVGVLDDPYGTNASRRGWQLLGYQIEGAKTSPFGPCAWVRQRS